MAEERQLDDDRGLNSVEIAYTGSRPADFRAAGEAAGFTADNPRPDNLTWHHVENGETMELVPRDLHFATRHTGGIATYAYLVEKGPLS